MKKSELKEIIKECLNEVLEEGPKSAAIKKVAKTVGSVAKKHKKKIAVAAAVGAAVGANERSSQVIHLQVRRKGDKYGIWDKDKKKFRSEEFVHRETAEKFVDGANSQHGNKYVTRKNIPGNAKVVDALVKNKEDEKKKKG